MNNKISVVIPLYNKERYIQRTIDSVLNQTFQNFECIIIDSSTDRSAEVVNHYNDPRLIHIIHEKSTAARARNYGIQIAQTDLIAFLDADDEWQPNHLETLYHLWNKFPDAGLYSTPYVKIKPDGRPMIMLFYGIPHPPWEGYVQHYLTSCSRGDEPVHSSSCAVPKDVLDQMGGFPENLVYGEDQFLWGKISLKYPLAYSWTGLTIYHTEALGRICDEKHAILEHPFSMYLRQELAAGTIPPEKKQEYLAYIKRKRLSFSFSNFLISGEKAICINMTNSAVDRSNGSLEIEDKFNIIRKILAQSLNRFYHSSVHDAFRRSLCFFYGCYNPGILLNYGKND